MAAEGFEYHSIGRPFVAPVAREQAAASGERG